MDDRPIDPFNPYARRYAPQAWRPPESALDDTQDIPVVRAPGPDDTQEVPVVPRQAAGSAESGPPPEPFAARLAQPVPAPPQWPTGVREPTTATPAPEADAPPFAPQLTVPPELVPPRGGRSTRKPLIAVGAGVVVLLALVAVVFFAIGPGTGGDKPDRAAANSTDSEQTVEDSGSSAEETKSSPSKNPKPESHHSSEPEPTEATDDDPPPDQKLTVPSRPTKFGAWFAGGGSYTAKWAKPANDGGADILSYIVGDCNGNNLAFVDSYTYRVTVNAQHLDCMSVYAVNNQGMGADAQHQITNNP